MSKWNMESASWMFVSAAELILIWQCAKMERLGSPVRKLTAPAAGAAPLTEFRLNRSRTTMQDDSDESPPAAVLEPPKSAQRFPVGFSPFRRCNVHSASISAESVSEKELAWNPSLFSPKDQQTKARLEEILANNILMTSLSSEGKATVVEAYERVEVGKGTVVVREGEIGDCCFIVESGRLSCDMKEKGHRCDYSPGQTFGELALMYGNTRAATITVTSTQALTPCVLWRLDRTTFKKIVLNAVQPNQRLFLTFISTVPIFNSLSQQDKEKLVTSSHHLLYPKGHILLKTGQLSAERYLYLIKSGKVAIIAQKKEVEVLGAGEFFGEKAILFDGSPTADAVVQTESEVFRVPEPVLQSCPSEFLSRLREYARNRYE